MINVCQQITTIWEQWTRVRGHWQELAAFFKLSAIRFFVSWFALVPIVAHALSEIPSEIQILISNNAHTIKTTLPFNWEILWLSSFLYAMSLSIYVIRCPGFIKKYGSYGIYSESKHSARWIVWELYYAWQIIGDKKGLLERLKAKGYAKPLDSIPKVGNFSHEPVVAKRGTVWVFGTLSSSYEVCLKEGEKDDVVGDIFWELFGKLSGSRPISRNLVWILMVVAVLLFAFAVGQNIYSIIQYFMMNR
jgi:hypothetical protein